MDGRPPQNSERGEELGEKTSAKGDRGSNRWTYSKAMTENRCARTLTHMAGRSVAGATAKDIVNPLLFSRCHPAGKARQSRSRFQRRKTADTETWLEFVRIPGKIFDLPLDHGIAFCVRVDAAPMTPCDDLCSFVMVHSTGTDAAVDVCFSAKRSVEFVPARQAGAEARPPPCLRLRPQSVHDDGSILVGRAWSDREADPSFDRRIPARDHWGKDN